MKRRSPPERARGAARCLPAIPLLAWVVATPALATDHFNLESDLPTSLEDIEPTERGTIEAQAFGRFVRLTGARSLGEAAPRLAWGPLERTQIEVSLPLSLGEGIANGNGDVEVSILRKLLDDVAADWWPGAAVEVDVRLPTGVARRGFDNRVDAGLTAIAKKDIGPHSFHFNAELDWSGDESDQESLRRVAWTVIVGHDAPLTTWLVLVSDVVWRQADDRHSMDVVSLETGVRAQVAPSLIGALGAGLGLDRGDETPMWTLTVGFQLGL